MVTRPSNHVTRQQAAAILAQLERTNNAAADRPLPDNTEDLLAYLSTLYPPRCYDPKTEDMEEHLKYAGKSELIEDLKYRLAEEAKVEGEPDETSDTD